MISRRTNPKPAHPVVAHDNAEIARAVSFSTSFFLGEGNYDRHPSMTLERAREVAGQMNADPEYVKTGRKAMIYAVMPEGHTILVPDDYTPPNCSLLPPGSDDGLNVPATLKREDTPQAKAGRTRSRNAVEERKVKNPPARASKAAKALGAQPPQFAAVKDKAPKKTKGRRPSVDEFQAALKAKPTIKDAVTAAIDAGLSPKQFRKVAEDVADNLMAKTPTEPTARRTAKALEVFVGIKQPSQRHLDALASAEAGKLPEVPDFSADTHKAYRGKLEAVLALVKAKDVDALAAMPLPTYDSSAVMLARYRNLAVVALTAQRELV